MNIWVRLVGAGISSLMLIAVAVRAAGSISGERDKQTFSDLLTTPLDSDAILFAKWLGSMLSVRWAWLWLCLVWMTAGLVTALNPVAVPIMIVAWFAYAAFLACLGLWFSMVCRTTVRAIVWTLFSGAAFFLGHWLIWLLFIPFFFHRPPDALEWVAKFQVGLTPPLAMSVSFPIFFFAHDNSRTFGPKEWVQFMLFGLIGVGFWAARGGDSVGHYQRALSRHDQSRALCEIANGLGAAPTAASVRGTLTQRQGCSASREHGVGRSGRTRCPPWMRMPSWMSCARSAAAGELRLTESNGTFAGSPLSRYSGRGETHCCSAHSGFRRVCASVGRETHSCLRRSRPASRGCGH